MKIINTKWNEYKSWIVFGLVSFFAIHMIIFTNYFPCWDTYGNLQMSYSAMRSIGRWFFGPSSILLHSVYDLEWCAGVLSAVFVTASSVLLIDLWEIKRRYSRAIIIFLIAAFPSMMATYVYMFLSAAYMLSFLLAMISAYLIVKGKGKRTILVGALFIAFSLGTYQAYLLAAISVILMYFVIRILHGDHLKSFRCLVSRLMVTVGSGGVLYKLIEFAYRQIDPYELSNYQGVSDVGKISQKQIAEAFNKLFDDIIKFFFWDDNCFYRLINIAVLICVVLIIVYYVGLNPKLSKRRKVVLLVVMFILLPLTYSFYFISPGVKYHRLMEFGNIFVYFFPLVLFEHVPADKIRFQQLAGVVKLVYIFMLTILSIYHFINDHVVYKQLEVYAERTRYETYEIINKIDEVAGSGTKQVAITGFFRFESDRYKITPIPDTVGINRSFHANPKSFVNFASFYYARNYNLVPQNIIDEIKESEEWKSMGAYPSGDYVKEINGIVVIKL